MSARSRVGRILARGAVTSAIVGLGIGVAPGHAAAAESLPSARPVSQPVSQPVPAQVVDPDAAASRASWEARGRPDRMAIVRDRRIDLVAQGRLARRAPGAVRRARVTSRSRSR